MVRAIVFKIWTYITKDITEKTFYLQLAQAEKTAVTVHTFQAILAANNFVQKSTESVLGSLESRGNFE